MEDEEDVNFEEMTLEERKKYCEDLDDFMKEVEESVKVACDSLGWTYESVDCELEPYMTCPFNCGHRVPERTMEKHLKKCEWNSLGYTKECKPLPDPSVPGESPSTIKFDIQLQHKVLQEAKRKNPKLNIGEEEKLIPQTSDRLMSDFTPDERKAMYEYVIANTVAPDIGQDIADLNKPEKSKSENAPSDTILELLAQERNLKRRRAKHRGVHTNKKSHTEVLREIVEKQMDMFKEYLAEKHGIPIPDDEENDNIESDRLREKNDIENSSRNSSKCEYQKDVDQSEQSNNSKSGYNRDYDKDYKNTLRDREYRNSSRYNRSDNRYGKHESRSRDRYNSNDRYNEKRNNKRRSSSHDRHRRHRNNSDTRDKYRDDNDSRDRRRDDNEFRNKRRDDDDSQDRHRDGSGSRNKRRDASDSQDRHRDGSDSRSKYRDEDDDAQDHHHDDSGPRNKRYNDDDSRDGSRSRYRNEDDSQGKSSNQNSSREYSETCDNNTSRRSRSRERKAQKNSKHDSRDRSNHKKHKKDKKRREKSADRDDDYGKHKASKR